MADFKLNNLPDSNLLWKGLGGNFSSLLQILNEFIDNSMSNLKTSTLELKRVVIKIQEMENKKYKITIKDTGTGILNLESAFTIGNKDSQCSSLNEHGFGMKHALAAANKNNNDWKVLTCSKELSEKHKYYKIEASYKIDQLLVKEMDDHWPGIVPTGTIIEFTITKQLLDTIVSGLRGPIVLFESKMKVLAEDLGYFYSYFIKESIASIQLQYKALDSEIEFLDIVAIEPKFDDTIDPGIGSTKIDLGGGIVDLEYSFVTATDAKLKKYYKANMSTSGVEIKLNGRLLESSLFKDIWGIEKHNSYNYILIRLNLKAADSKRLPITTTNKSGLRSDDPKLEKLFEWIRSKLPEPKKRASLSDHETDLFVQLKEKKKLLYADIDPSSIVDTEQNCFRSINEKIRIDLYQSVNNITTIYEGKKDKTSPQDVYQLIMYWDGLVADEIKIDKAILISAYHPESVKALVENKNNSLDINGNYYVIKLKSWKDEDIDYPN